MYSNIGEKIKGLAIANAIIGFIGSIVGMICLFIVGMVLVGILVLVAGCLLSWIGSFVLYGFGELVTKADDISICVKRLQILEAYKTPKDAVGLKSEIIDEIQNEVVDDYENEKYGYQDESDKENLPKGDECPCCFSKISPEDKECPNCGYKLK